VLSIATALTHLTQTNMNPDDMLSFLFQLGSLELGQDYSKSSLSPTQVQMLEDLNDLGLVCQTSPQSSRFYPTRLATTLTSDASALRQSAIGGGLSAAGGASSESSGFIVLETNYRLYAYTTSDLQIAILALFARLTARYPNLVAGKLTRQSVRAAVSMGITADQIVGFLTAHAHTQMRQKNNPVLPPSVVDQIRLWQIEGERMRPTNGWLFRDFANQAEYDDVVAYAKDLGVLRWKNDAKKLCFLTEVQQMGAFIQARKRKMDK
jgi:transcription initiation factor TFIIH subunit 4